MSELKVNKISPRSGTDVTLGDSADTITIPSGATLDASNATVTYPAGSITDAAISSTAAIQQSKILGSPGFRNIIINGDMSIAQRGTSFTSQTGSNFIVDRFIQNINGSMGTWSNGQETDVPTGQGFATSLKMDCTTADAAPAAADFVRVEQRFEGQNLQYIKKGTANAESLTLSFWVKSNKTGTYIAELEDRDNSRYVSKSYTVDVTDTWEFKTATFPGDATGTLNNDNGESLRLNFWLGAGTDWTSGTLGTTWHTTAANRAVGQVNLADDTANDWYITGVQLEAGTTASDFEFLPVDVNLARCQRYYYEVTNPAVSTEEFSIGSVYAAGQFETVFPYPVTMRAQPSSSVVCETNEMSVLTNQTNDAIDGLSGSGQMGINQGMRFTSGDNFGGTQGYAGRLRKVSADVRINFSAEL
jgi:hypothetical protein